MIELNLTQHPSPILTTLSKEVLINPETQEFCATFYKYYTTLIHRLGRGVVGLAAPQVGYNYRIFIVMGNIYINPEITWVPKGGIKFQREGCLSLPAGKYWDVSRPYGCILKWQTIDGDWCEQKFNNLEARAILHEMDHLNGKLCCGDDLPE